MSPVLVADATSEIALLQADVFAPVLALVPVRECVEELRFNEICPYALGASVFRPEEPSRRMAARLRAGAITINDLIVPTADPRLPFGGRGQSGYGVTRGAAGLRNKSSAFAHGSPTRGRSARGKQSARPQLDCKRAAYCWPLWPTETSSALTWPPPRALGLRAGGHLGRLRSIRTLHPAGSASGRGPNPLLAEFSSS